MATNETSDEKRGPLAGLLVFLAKVGAKLLTVLLKLVKFLKFGKLALAASSFAVYAMLFSWKFAAVLIGALVFHEYGHLWAMKRRGMRTKGIYLIPLIGAAAVSEDAFKSRGEESYVALMGPIWGCALAAAVYALYLATGRPVIAVVAGWMAMLNLFNLLPINPLDGGRVMKSIAYSIHSKLGWYVTVAMLAACFAAAFKLNLGLVAVLIIIAALEMFSERKEMRRLEDQRAVTAVLSEALDCSAEPADVAAALEGLRNRWPDVPRAAIERFVSSCEEAGGRFCRQEPMLEYFRIPSWELLSADDERLYTDLAMSVRYMDRLTEYAARTALPVRRSLGGRWPYQNPYSFNSPSSVARFLRHRATPRMKPTAMAVSVGAYLVLAAALLGLMYATAHVPAAKAALNVFMD